MKEYICIACKDDMMKVWGFEGMAQFRIGDKHDLFTEQAANLSMEDTKDLIVYLQSVVDKEEKKKAEMLRGLKTNDLIGELKKRTDIHSISLKHGERFSFDVSNKGTLLWHQELNSK